MMVQYFKDRSTIKDGANTADVGLSFQGDIIVGEFVDKQRPTLLDNYHARMTEALGDKYKPYRGAQ